MHTSLCDYCVYSLFRHPNILQLMSACHLSRSLSFVLVFERVRCGSLNYSLYDQVRNIYSKLRCFAVLLYFCYLKCFCRRWNTACFRLATSWNKSARQCSICMIITSFTVRYRRMPFISLDMALPNLAILSTLSTSMYLQCTLFVLTVIAHGMLKAISHTIILLLDLSGVTVKTSR